MAKVVAVIVGLAAVLSPLISLPIVRHFQLTALGPFIFLGELVSLGCFLAPLSYRHYLHLLPAFWVFLLAGILAIISLMFVLEPEASRKRLALVVTLFCVAVGSIMMSMTIFAAEAIFFYVLHGKVALNQEEPAPRCDVYLRSAIGEEYFRTLTDKTGQYAFLITRPEAERAGEVLAGEDERAGQNWAVVDWDFHEEPPPRQHRESLLTARQEQCAD